MDPLDLIHLIDPDCQGANPKCPRCGNEMGIVNGNDKWRVRVACLKCKISIGLLQPDETKA